MIPVHVQTLIVSTLPAPSVIVLQPLEDNDPAENSRIVPIWVGINEATQLGIALEKARFARPMTHDLLLDALTNLDACVDHVVITEMKGSTFYSKLVLRHHGHLTELDARPSDAIALALRQSAPLYIEESVLEKASFPYVFKKHPDEETEVEEFRTFVEGLAPEDFEE
ncbi:MAG: bifunctional nuclease family protein [Raoultibacter sp.]